MQPQNSIDKEQQDTQKGSPQGHPGCDEIDRGQREMTSNAGEDAQQFGQWRPGDDPGLDEQLPPQDQFREEESDPENCGSQF